MEKRFPHSQEDVRAIQSSFQMYLASRPDFLLQTANSQRIDIFQLLFDKIAEQKKADLEPRLREKLPLCYQQDLELAFFPTTGDVAMETSTMTTGLFSWVHRCMQCNVQTYKSFL